MIRALTALRDMWRGLVIESAPHADPSAHAAQVRAIAEGFAKHSGELRAKSYKLFDAAEAAGKDFPKRQRLYAQALAMEQRAEAYHWLAGSTSPEAVIYAAELLAEADETETRGGMRAVVAVEPTEAAHA